MAVNKSRKRASKRAGKRATAPTINPQPVVRPIVPGGHKETVGTDRKNNERAITIHVKAIVKKGRAYYADKKKGVGFWDAHNKYYEDKMEQRASTEAKKKKVRRNIEKSTGRKSGRE
ncbi:hypothetical protein FN846DRAFT_895094 [Sphaerosporella brunnea]|uniref:Uncharacterized protein n=1 Tax=Sphaerosporella brunnea TaxID=1250544 RepID=A0A5J5EH69_9PEZI|nr:hypothetical protein FN846DRAFT_895094 [Sphaerosporella brunnea]